MESLLRGIAESQDHKEGLKKAIFDKVRKKPMTVQQRIELSQAQRVIIIKLDGSWILLKLAVAFTVTMTKAQFNGLDLQYSPSFTLGITA
jgi:hypothetical protein